MMQKRFKIYTILSVALIVISLLFLNSCFFFPGEVSQGSKSQLSPDSIVVPSKASYEDYSLPDTRRFNIGFTPFPYDFEMDALDFTYANINHHSDLVIHHLDSGIPWEEALNNSNLPRNLLYDFNERISKAGKDKKIYLAVTPLNTYRDKIAAYWRESENKKSAGKWKNKKFNEPETMQAYLNYCKFMIEKFDPEYFAYGIEVNMLGYHDPQAFEEFLVLAENTYNSLKEIFPDLPVFLTFQLETFIQNFGDQEKIIKDLLPYTDYISISSYPFANFPDPGDIPPDWFSRLYNMAPEKPIAIA